MDFDNDWDRSICLPLYNGFALVSQELDSNSPFSVSDIFAFTAPANAYTNPKVTLIAPDNSFVINPARSCSLRRGGGQP